MPANVMEWLNLVFRWAHVFAAILWVGSTYYFTWLDAQMRRLESSGAKGGVWMVHSGGFYTVVKQHTLSVPPAQVHWFRYEALFTFLTGFILLNLLYYHGGLMVDPIDPKIGRIAASIVGVATLLVGFALYDVLAKMLGKNDVVFGVISFVLIIALTYGLSTILSSRATYMHVGALFGTIMVANVWMRILPPQRRMIAAAAKGATFDAATGAGAKLRSKHNTFLAVPTTFIMISNHFPTATYGNHYAVAILGALILLGWGGAALIRRG
jgi:uncharacterized membrane protein